MRRDAGFVLTFVLSTVLLVGHAVALEKGPRRENETNPNDPWTAGATCAIVYYNMCTGWSWSWSGFGNGERIGVHVQNPPTPSLLTSTTLRVFSGAVPGWGFTGTVGIHAADANGCPTGPPLAQVIHLPEGPFDTHVWSVPVSGDFAVVYTRAGRRGDMSVIGSDHPSAAPYTPQACGFCYPMDRPNHSYRWGTLGQPNCPGVPFFDGVCDAQLRVDIMLACPDAVELAGWGRIKAMYR